MAELLPCPFCGRTPSKVKERKTPSIIGTYYIVECKGKGSRCSVKPCTRLCNTPQAAIEAWNRRYTHFEVGDTIRIPLPKDKKIMTYEGEEIDFDYAAEDE